MSRGKQGEFDNANVISRKEIKNAQIRDAQGVTCFKIFQIF